jgi:hypothetical protein
MKRLLKVLLIIFLLQLSCASLSSAADIKNKSQYLLDTRGDDGDIFSNLISFQKKTPSGINLSSFGEVQWNMKTSEWEKINFGVKAEKIFRKFFYLSQSIQTISGQRLDHMYFDTGNISVDTTVTIGFIFDFAEYFSLSLKEDYSFNIEEGKGEYCEVLAEISYNPTDSRSIGIGWRHTDRIHNFDSDYATISLSLNF